MKRLVLPLLGLFFLGAAPETPQAPRPAPQPTFQTEVELVTVDVAVVDKKGQSVRGLTRDDFVVTENDAPQTLTSFEAVVVPGGPASLGRGAAADGRLHERRSRQPARPHLRGGVRRHPPLADAGPARPGRGRGLPPERGGGRRRGDPRRHRRRGLVDRPDAGGA